MMGNESKSARSCVVEEFARLTQERDEAMATIEALRRRVAELEGEVDRYKGYAKDRQRTLKRVRGEKKHLANCLAKITERCDELKRQVETLQEDAEVVGLMNKWLGSTGRVTLNSFENGTFTYSLKPYRPNGLLEALREAAKGEVE